MQWARTGPNFEMQVRKKHAWTFVVVPIYDKVVCEKVMQDPSCAKDDLRSPTHMESKK